jgi:hypothetical protein
MKPCIVLESHNASYADPINVAKGEFLSLTGQEDVWDGHRWLWAVADDGRDGWVPDDLITEIDERPAASRDFSAIELTCSAGEVIHFIWETHGWAWCRKCDGSEGWMPLRNLSER